MAVYFLNNQWKELEQNILEIFALEEKNELLTSDLIGNLMSSMRCGFLKTPEGMRRWKGLTSRDIMYVPEGAKFKSDLEFIGDFGALMVHFGYKIRYEKHGSGVKEIACI